MFLLVDFGETKRKNKEKKRLWESNRASLNSNSTANTEAFLEGRRKRGILKDPLALRSYEGISYGSSGAKITAPYRTKTAYVDVRRQKGLSKRINAVNDYKFKNLAGDIPDIQTNRRVGNSKTRGINLLERDAKPDIIPPKKAVTTSSVLDIKSEPKIVQPVQKSVTKIQTNNIVSQPKLKTGSKGLLLAGGLGLGAIGAGLYLANRKKKEKENG